MPYRFYQHNPIKRKRSRFSRQRIAEIFEVSSIQEVALTLGVPYTTVYRWMSQRVPMPVHPKMSASKTRHYEVYRDELIAWLIATDRFKTRQEW
jgi:transposase